MSLEDSVTSMFPAATIHSLRYILFFIYEPSEVDISFGLVSDLNILVED
jgi:hypothetical protein